MVLFEGLSLFGLGMALALPWLTGVLAVRLLVGRQASGLECVGFGFFVGQLIVIAVLLAWGRAFGLLTFWPLAALLAGLAVLLGRLVRRDRHLHQPAQHPAELDQSWLSLVASMLLLGLILGLILARSVLMAQELGLRPLFPWDAWMNWVPRAVVWFHHGELTPFVLPPEWLAAEAAQEVYTLGNWLASGYPPGIPLMLLWTMLGGGTADHTLLFLPWLLGPAAFALVLWTHLRALGLGPALALVAVYLFVSLPFVNTHSMLAGYADLWLALYFSLGVMAAERWQREPVLGHLVLGVIMAAGCALMKTPGIIFGALVLLSLILARIRLPPRWLGRGVIIGLAAIALLLLGGLIPVLTDLPVAGLTLQLPAVLPDLRLQPQPLLPILFHSLFVSSNWHLLWLVLGLAGLAALWVRGRAVLDSLALLVLVVAASLLVFVFGYTQYFELAENLVTLNRALMYLVPLAVYLIGAWLTLCFAAAQVDAG